MVMKVSRLVFFVIALGVVFACAVFPAVMTFHDCRAGFNMTQVPPALFNCGIGAAVVLVSFGIFFAAMLAVFHHYFVESARIKETTRLLNKIIEESK